MNIDALLKQARDLWGNEHCTLDEIILRLGVVFGDICRIARTQQENGNVDETELKKELGNIIFSMIRWCDDLGYDPKECVGQALQAQTTYVTKLHNTNKKSGSA